MRTIYHLPNHLDFPEKVTSDQRLRLQKVIVTSIRRAAQSRSNGGQRIERESAQALSPTEEFTPQRLSANGNSYAVPSYDDGGAPKAVPIKRTTAAPQPPPKLRWRHPKGAAADDKVISGGSPFDDQLIAIFPHWQAVRVKGDRYAVSNNLRRAITWGNLLFGARSYAILEGPTGKVGLHYYVVGTTHALHAHDAAPGSGLSVAGGEVWGLKQRIYWQPQLHDDHHGFYMLRALFTAEGQPMWPMSQELVEEFYSELKLGKPQEQFLPPALARPLVFGEIDKLIAADKTEEAARKLAELDANAFALVDWTVKAKYLEILTDAWTLEAEEKAIIEILKSMSGRAELDAALALLKKKDKFDKLFRDINSQLWSLLIEVGKRFGDTAPFSYRELVHLLQDAGLVPRDWKEIAKQITLGAAGPVLNPNLFAEAEEAARSFVEFLGGALEGLVMLVAHPDRLIEGIAQLVKLSVMVQLAEMGYQPAVDFVANILKQLATSVVDGMKGAAVLGIGESLVRRVKWAIIWEVASWFIGIGEIKAAITGAGVSEKLAALGRLLRILRLLGRAGEAEQAALKLEQLARLVREISILTHEDEVLRLFSHLPEEDLLRLTERLEKADLQGVQSMAELTAKHPELAQAARHALGRAEALYQLERKAGRLSDNLVEGFQKLATRSGFNNSELSALMDALPGEHAELYMRLVRNMPERAFGAGIGARSYDFFTNLAQHPRAMSFMADTGYETFSALYRHSRYDFARFEENLQALEDLAQKMPVDQRAVEYQRLLDRLNRGDDAAAQELRTAVNARRAAAGQPLIRSYSAAQLEEIVRTTADIRQIRKLAAQMDNGSAGNLFELWAEKYIFKQQSRKQIVVTMENNPHLERLEHGRRVDGYFHPDGSFWEAKLYQSGGDVDIGQMDDYRKMMEAGFVFDSSGQRVTITQVNYIFSDRAAAAANSSELHDMGIFALFIDDGGMLQHLP
ncbi:MAG: hypothetical protein R3C14_10735 [Caldilineaceae bacterium]